MNPRRGRACGDGSSTLPMSQVSSAIGLCNPLSLWLQRSQRGDSGRSSFVRFGYRCGSRRDRRGLQRARRRPGPPVRLDLRRVHHPGTAARSSAWERIARAPGSIYWVLWGNISVFLLGAKRGRMYFRNAAYSKTSTTITTNSRSTTSRPGMPVRIDTKRDTDKDNNQHGRREGGPRASAVSHVPHFRTGTRFVQVTNVSDPTAEQSPQAN